jgi:hypothetical protein
VKWSDWYISSVSVYCSVNSDTFALCCTAKVHFQRAFGGGIGEPWAIVNYVYSKTGIGSQILCADHMNVLIVSDCKKLRRRRIIAVAKKMTYESVSKSFRTESITQPPIHWVPGALSLGVKRLGLEADHSPSSSAELKEWVELYLHSPNTP